MPIVLNMGAGSKQPLPKHGLANISEFANCEIINLDIYNQIIPYSADGSTVPFPNSDIRYSDAEKKIELDDNSVDFIIAVSPYNYAVLNQETLRVLKKGGVALIIGNDCNKYVTKIQHMCSARIAADFFELFELLPANDLAIKCITFLAERGSFVTSGKKETEVNFANIAARK